MRSLCFTVATALLVAAPALAQSWGTIKGKVVWDEKDIPKGEVANVAKEPLCLVKGPVVKDILVIDSKTKGVKNVMVWLAPLDDKAKIVQIHPSLRAVPAKPVEVDQPCCLFEPRIVMMREGQPLVIKNSANIAHNTRITGRDKDANDNPVNPPINTTIPGKGQVEFSGAKALKAESRPLMIACDIHGWMGGRVAVFNHPYYALSKEDGSFEIKDAPAGKFRIFIQHEAAGWLHTPRTSKGQTITIPAGGTLDLGTVKLKGEHLQN